MTDITFRNHRGGSFTPCDGPLIIHTKSELDGFSKGQTIIGPDDTEYTLIESHWLNDRICRLTLIPLEVPSE
ncbi:hypothetical protein GMLC_21500 [Geomonas limicola]|uniref:Uncharacterized protein n=1 Tax=Geomonas limicola TaxID=2740186 RepID=A0A6V8N7U3_9BACT|nr:hypothetical protein [Geomonas limicola]GFO68571.1 hypothetical protein GMLC_21500 [Geomonas limicola]